MFERLKYKLYKEGGFSTEYQSIRNKQSQMKKQNQSYEHFLSNINNVVDELLSLLNEIEKYINEDSQLSIGIRGNKFEIERIKNKLKNIDSDNDCNKYFLQLQTLEEKIRRSIQSLVSFIFNNLKNGTINNAVLVNKYRTFLTYLKIVIDNDAYMEFSDKSAFDIINKLINCVDLAYGEIEDLKNHLLTVQSRAKMNLSKSSNDIYAFNRSDKVRIYDTLDEKKRR